MKDEELFKAWKSEQYKDQSTEGKLEFVEHLHTFPKYFEKTFLAGLKAGRPQWHDLRKDPNDLPKENELYLVFGYTNKREKFYELDVFDLTEEEFLGCGEYVYAWCEIPTFDKE